MVLEPPPDGLPTLPVHNRLMLAGIAQPLMTGFDALLTGRASITELAEREGVDDRYVRNWRSTGKIKSVGSASPKP